jgi:hypothetical protein
MIQRFQMDPRIQYLLLLLEQVTRCPNRSAEPGHERTVSTTESPDPWQSIPSTAAEVSLSNGRYGVLIPEPAVDTAPGKISS